MSFIRVVLKGLDIYFSTIPQISEGYVKINIIYTGNVSLCPDFNKDNFTVFIFASDFHFRFPVTRGHYSRYLQLN